MRMGVELAENIKQAVQTWRDRGYQDTSEVSRRLLEFWFKEEHYLSNGNRFEFWRCQREAIEHLIYIYEVCGYDSLYKLSQGFEAKVPLDPTQDKWAKYCFKMATGSGKTFVMALAIIWQYFNKFFGTSNDRRYSSHYLLIAPNLIVLDRLSDAFVDNKVFKGFPFIPKEWEPDFDLQLIHQSKVVPLHSKGVLHLTNIQQIYSREPEEAINPLQEALGARPPGEDEVIYSDLLATLSGYDDLMVMNDEAHHVYSSPDPQVQREWSKTISYLDTALKGRNEHGLVMQLDFSATPKDLAGTPFAHIVYDYSLRQAIQDKIVKHPRIGIIEGAPPPMEKEFVKRNQIQIDTGVKLLSEFKRDLGETGKKPVLFIMTDVTTNADRVGNYLKQDLGFSADKVLVIHTDTKGIITKTQLEQARKWAREVDKPENPYEAIVSVMMLKEGWDVKNVCVIVPLRAFDSPLLPEQTLGRGLRRMSPAEEGWDEKLIVVDHPRFRSLWEAEVGKGDLDVEITSIKTAYKSHELVKVDLVKLIYDFSIPIVEGGVTKITPDLSQLDITKLPSRLFVFSQIELPKVMYKEKDLLTQQVTQERELTFDYTDNHVEYLAYITRAILSKAGSSAQFAELVPKVREYIQGHLFDVEIGIQDPEVVKKLNYMPTRERIRAVFVNALNDLSKTEEETTIASYYQISQTEPFHTSEEVYPARKTIFNHLPISKKSRLEKGFMRYLDEQNKVLAFTKVMGRMPLRIHYYNQEGMVSSYTPDFVVKTESCFYLMEIKGELYEELESTKLKARAAEAWCENVSKLTQQKWSYLKVTEDNFYQYRDQSLGQFTKFLKET
jgi:type III restriction enzyme